MKVKTHFCVDGRRYLLEQGPDTLSELDDFGLMMRATRDYRLWSLGRDMASVIDTWRTAAIGHWNESGRLGEQAWLVLRGEDDPHPSDGTLMLLDRAGLDYGPPPVPMPPLPPDPVGLARWRVVGEYPQVEGRYLVISQHETERDARQALARIRANCMTCFGWCRRMFVVEAPAALDTDEVARRVANGTLKEVAHAATA